MIADFQERVAAGDIPEDVAEITTGCKQLLRVNSRVSQTIAVCIAAVYERLERKKWVEWCADELGMKNVQYRSNLARVGRRLLYLARSERDMPYYARLFECDVDKLIALSRLPEDQLAAFVSHNPDMESIKREELRRRIAEYLHEETSSPTEEQPELPGFDEMITGALAWEPEALVAEVRDADAADRSRQAGLLFLAAGLEYEKSRDVPDVAKLQEIKAALLSEVEDIEKAIAKAL